MGSFNLNKNDFTSKQAVLTGKVGQKPPFVQDAKGFSSLQIAMITEIIGQATVHDWIPKVIEILGIILFGPQIEACRSCESDELPHKIAIFV